MRNWDQVTFRKSTRSSPSGDNCVEVAVHPDGTIGVRDSKDKTGTGAVLEFTTGEWDAFVGGAKDGEFDF